jgi:hypothetical protein
LDCRFGQYLQDCTESASIKLNIRPIPLERILELRLRARPIVSSREREVRGHEYGRWRPDPG